MRKVKNAFTYTGRELDEETGLYYYRARYYDPTIGRFTTKDPIGFRGGDVSLFAYVGNNPIRYIDPLGLYWQYSQSTGQMTYVNDQTGVSAPIGSGYSGLSEGFGKNDPSMQYVPFVGPIPEGTYQLGNTSDSKGPFTVPVIPDPGTNTMGRGGFLVHGNNSNNNNSASMGCIVMPYGARVPMSYSPDRQLKVVP